MGLKGHLLDDVSEHDPEAVEDYLLECIIVLAERLKKWASMFAKKSTPGNPVNDSTFNETELTQEPPFLTGHRIGNKSVITKGGIKAPGEIVTLDDLGGNTDQWADLVSRGVILINPEVPNPGLDAELLAAWKIEKAKRTKDEIDLTPFGRKS